MAEAMAHTMAQMGYVGEAEAIFEALREQVRVEIAVKTVEMGESEAVE